MSQSINPERESGASIYQESLEESSSSTSSNQHHNLLVDTSYVDEPHTQGTSSTSLTASTAPMPMISPPIGATETISTTHNLVTEQEDVPMQSDELPGNADSEEQLQSANLDESLW